MPATSEPPTAPAKCRSWRSRARSQNVGVKRSSLRALSTGRRSFSTAAGSTEGTPRMFGESVPKGDNRMTHTAGSRTSPRRICEKPALHCATFEGGFAG